MLSSKTQGGLRSGRCSDHPTISLDFNLPSSLFRLCPILFEVEFQSGCSFLCSINLINHLSWLMVSYGKHERCIHGHEPVLTLLWKWDRGDSQAGRKWCARAEMENAHRMQGWCGSQVAIFYLGQQARVGILPGEVICRVSRIR